MKTNIILIGPRGVGKSKTGRNLAHLTSHAYLSTDTLFSYEHEGMTIAEFLRKSNNNWSSFRESEFSILSKVVLLQHTIIDCGGGMVIDLDKNQQEIYSQRKTKLMKNHGIVVYMKADLDWLAQKATDSENRPQLSNKMSYKKIMESRHPHYKKIADITIDATARKGKDLALELYYQLRQKDFII